MINGWKVPTARVFARALRSR